MGMGMEVLEVEVVRVGGYRWGSYGWGRSCVGGRAFTT